MVEAIFQRLVARLIDSPDTIFRDPMVMEFPGLEQRVAYDEPELEKAILRTFAVTASPGNPASALPAYNP